MVWVSLESGEMSYSNAAWQNYTRSASSPDSFSKWIDYVHPEEQEKAVADWLAHSSSLSSFRTECRLRDGQQSYRWFLVEVTPQRKEKSASLLWIGSCTDIHEQKNRQRDLERKLAVQSDMLDISIDCIKVIHPNGRLSTMNKAGCLALGVSEHSEFGMDWIQLLPPDVHETGQAALDKARSGKHARFPGKSQLPGCTPQYWDNLLTPLVDTEGSTTAILCVSREVTQQREAEILLRRSEERLRLALESGQIGIWDIDLVTGDMHCDLRAQQAFGIHQDKTSLEHVLAAAHPDDRGLVERSLAGAISPYSTGRYDVAFRSVDEKNGTCRWLIAKGQVSFLEDKDQRVATRFAGTVLDITEKELSEKELLETQNRAREVLERTTDCIIMLNARWEFTYLNPNAVELISAGRDLLGENFWNEFPDASNRAFGPQYQYVVEKQEAVQFEEFYPAPLNKWFDVQAYPMNDGIAIFFRDSTERRRAEEALIRSEKLAAAGRLAASVSHEINNPLEAVTNLLYLIDKDTALSSTSREYLDTAQTELARVSQVAIQTLQFYRQSTSAAKVLLEGLLDTILGFFRTRLHATSTTVVKKYRYHVPVVAFEGELRQVFTNIISNAIDAFAIPGHLFIRTRLLSREVFGSDYVAVTIADTGSGMSQEILGKCFEPFFSTKGIIGTGLGLWVSKGIIEKHHGKIYVRSNDTGRGHGTVLMILIPQKTLEGSL